MKTTNNPSRKDIPDLFGNKTIRMICDYKNRKKYHILFSVFMGFCALSIIVLYQIVNKTMPDPHTIVFWMMRLMAYIPIFVAFYYIGYHLFVFVNYYFDKKKLKQWIDNNPNDERIKWMTFKWYIWAMS